MRLHLTGIAESDEALLELLDNLFAHPAFDSPQLPNEVRRPEGVSFSLNVLYLPGIAAAAAAAPTPTVTELDPAALPSPTPGVAP